MKDGIIKSYNFNLLYANELVKDIDDDLITKVPGKGFENHAAFTLGHLISGSALISKYLGGPYDFKPEWEDLFRRTGPGDARLPKTESNLYRVRMSFLMNCE